MLNFQITTCRIATMIDKVVNILFSALATMRQGHVVFRRGIDIASAIIVEAFILQKR